MLDLTADIIDIRDIIERYEELETFFEDEYSHYTESTNDPMEYDDWLKGSDVVELVEANEELTHLSTILEELKGYGGDEQWRGAWYPLTLIRDGRAFEDYMDELLEDCGDLPRWDKLPSFVRIVVDYDQLKWDYQTIEIDGEDYLYR